MSTIPDPRARDPEGLSRIFRHFGEVESPPLAARLYTEVALAVAADPELLALAARVDPAQPAPNVLYAAVQDLLLEDAERSPEARELARFYPAVSAAPIPDEAVAEAFRACCLRHRDELLPRLREGRTQTCVVHRCAVILPGLASLPRLRAAEGRVGLLEIGPSAGLNLRLDQYRYTYTAEATTPGRRAEWGDPSARPHLECEARGGTLPPLPARLEVVARRGLELAPIDLGEASALRWLRALIWPEHVERARFMDEALAHAARTPVEIEAGDATRDIEAAVARLPDDAPRVVYATQVFYQIPREGRRALMSGLVRASRKGPLDLLVMDATGLGESRLDWFAFEGRDRAERQTLAHVDSHGRWLDWGRTGPA